MPSAIRKSKPSERLALPAQQARSRATRERLLAAGEKVFASKGYEGARLVDIAAEAGCSVGSVYVRFKDKDGLFLAIAEDFAQGAREMLPMLVAADDPDQIVRNCVERTAFSFREHRGLFRAIIERGFEQPHLTASVFALRDERAKTVEAALRRAGVKRRDLTLAVKVAMQLLHGFLITATLNPRAPASIDDKRAIDEVSKACIAYLGAE